MTDLTDEQKAALIEALDRASDVYAFGDECQMANTIPPHSGIWVSGPGPGPTDATVRLTPAGRLLAQSLKRERELTEERDAARKAAIAGIWDHRVDDDGPYVICTACGVKCGYEEPRRWHLDWCWAEGA